MQGCGLVFCRPIDLSFRPTDLPHDLGSLGVAVTLWSIRQQRGGGDCGVSKPGLPWVQLQSLTIVPRQKVGKETRIDSRAGASPSWSTSGLWRLRPVRARPRTLIPGGERQGESPQQSWQVGHTHTGAWQGTAPTPSSCQLYLFASVYGAKSADF